MSFSKYFFNPSSQAVGWVGFIPLPHGEGIWPYVNDIDFTLVIL